MKDIIFIIPTFKEKEKIENLIKSFSHIPNQNIEIVIINGNPEDETSRWLKTCNDNRIIELNGDPTLYWSGLVNVGLNYALRKQDEPQFIFIMNADIQFHSNILVPFLRRAGELKKFQLAAVTVSRSKVISSGVKVLSWFLTLNRHPLAGIPADKMLKNQLIPVDFLPTRCIMFPFDALTIAGLVNERFLPHYGGDYEFTYRLTKLGYPAFICTDAIVELDSTNTGVDVFNKKLSLTKRIKFLFSIKSTSNPFYRLQFVLLVYPWYTIPSAILLYFLRSFLEVLFGGYVIKKIFTRKEAGFSGT